VKNFLFFSLIIFFQINYSQDFPDSFLKKSAKTIIEQSKTCVFNSIDKNGGLSSRIMDPFIPNNDFIVYLVTNPNSRKVEEIKVNPKVALTFQNSEGYVAIKGLSFLILDLDTKKKFWKKEWSPHYKNIDKNAILIKVIPLSMEVVNSSEGIVGNKENWSPAKIIF
tara:strand:+ start:26 stop:523 length:498 start_codon:yes stop_codon:yes gene_type:complete